MTMTTGELPRDRWTITSSLPYYLQSYSSTAPLIASCSHHLYLLYQHRPFHTLRMHLKLDRFSSRGVGPGTSPLDLMTSLLESETPRRLRSRLTLTNGGTLLLELMTGPFESEMPADIGAAIGKSLKESQTKAECV